MEVVPQATQGTCARRFSSSQIRRRTRVNPPSDSEFHSNAKYPAAPNAKCTSSSKLSPVSRSRRLTSSVTSVFRMARASSWKAKSSSDSSTREKSIVVAPRPVPSLASSRGRSRSRRPALRWLPDHHQQAAIPWHAPDTPSRRLLPKPQGHPGYAPPSSPP